MTRSLPGRQQPVQPPHAVGERAGGDLAAGRAGRAPRGHAVQQRLAGPGEFRAQRGDGVPFDGRTAGEADVQQLADGGARAVAADQVTAAPPGAVGAAGVRGDARRLLFDGVETAVHGDLDEPLAGERVAQGAGQLVLGECSGAGGGQPGRPEPEAMRRSRITCLRRIDRQPAQREPVVVERRPVEPLHEGGGVLAQHHGAGGPLFVLAGALVEDDGGHALAGQREGEREPDGPGADDDHRVHGAAPPARSGVLGDVREQAGGAGCAITERMQPIAGACVK